VGTKHNRKTPLSSFFTSLSQASLGEQEYCSSGNALLCPREIQLEKCEKSWLQRRKKEIAGGGKTGNKYW